MADDRGEEIVKLITGERREPAIHEPQPLPPPDRELAERGLDEEVQRKEIPYEEGRPAEQSQETRSAPTGPGEGREIEFTTYTPFSPAIGVMIPPDPSGADGADRVVLHLGNSYLLASNDDGQTFTEHDATTFLPAAQGRAVDQVMIYVPHRRLFAWMMQHDPSPGTGEGNFRLSVAHASDLASDPESGWTTYDFTSTDLGVPGMATDRQDLAFSESRLYMATNLVGSGRVVMSLSLDDLDSGQAVNWTRSDPLDGMFQFSHLSQQNVSNVHSVAIATSSRLRVMLYDDGAGTYGFHDVAVAQFPVASDLQSLDPNGDDWLTRGVANVSASVITGDDLWVAWDAATSAAGESPNFPNAHVRFARINRSNWTAVQEHQVWNPDYAFAYGCLAVGNDNDLAYGVGVGGSSDFPNSCFGILGDFVVYFRDVSSATAGAGSEPRWGDYLTVRPSERDSRRYSAFGYYTELQGTSRVQQPFFLSYGRP